VGQHHCRHRPHPQKLGLVAWGLTFPLITKADGTKFGKTEGGAVWLDPEKDEPLQVLPIFREHRGRQGWRIPPQIHLLSRTEIEELEAKHAANPAPAKRTGPSPRRDCTRAWRRRARRRAQGQRHPLRAEVGDTSEETFRDVVGEIPTKDLERAKLDGAGAALTDLLVHSGLAPSKGQARKDIEGGGIYVNNVKSPDITRALTSADLLFGKYVLLRKGKRTYAVLSLV